MTVETENLGKPIGSPWRIAAWSIVPLILLVPLIAMRFTDEVKWTVFDFAIAAALLIGVGVALELAVRNSRNTAYRFACGLALLAAFLLIWINGAVGIIGSEDNNANLMYGGVLAVGFIGALIARFRPRVMAMAMFAAAAVQVLVAVIALFGDLGGSESGPMEILGLTGFFAALWMGAGLLFRRAESTTQSTK